MAAFYLRTTQMDKRQLRAIGHQLKPVVMVAGNGLSNSVMEEIDRALNDHELIKIKLSVNDREERKQLANEICETCSAEKVQEIGKVLLVLRKNSKPNPKTSNLIRYLSK